MKTRQAKTSQPFEQPPTVEASLHDRYDQAKPERTISANHPYRDQAVALLTQHGKERLIAPVLDASLGCRIEHVTGYDTDLLGTFTRDIPRAGSQIEAARKKARLGMQLADLPLGIASEGAFGADPMIGMVPWNSELLIWIDDARGLEIVGQASGAANFAHRLAEDWTAVEDFARQWGFPEHHIVLRPEGDDDPRIHKGICNGAELETSFNWAFSRSPTHRIFLETDVRAHANPTRQDMIRRAAQDLSARLCSLCPACGAPGFWLIERLGGLPCEDCGAPTRETIIDLIGCRTCGEQEQRQSTSRKSADPSRCDYCNP
ncbi:MAG: DUF6671 family protein [Dokdonella sp.]